ncbi:MAG: hypothetical protein RJA81_1158, partial [Planctomycetota bacterium]
MGTAEKKKKAETSVQKGDSAKSTTPSSSTSKEIASFIGNLARTNRYKASQGFNARTATAIGLGVILVSGLYQLSETLKVVTTPVWVSQPLARIGIPLILAVISGWFLFRLINFPTFAEFLIATESEMNKVSWTTSTDLKRITSVVLVTVVLMTTYL